MPTLTPDPADPDRSSLDRQIKDFDEVSRGCEGVMKAGVFVDDRVDKPYLKLYTDVGGDGRKNKERNFKNAVEAYETPVEEVREGGGIEATTAHKKNSLSRRTQTLSLHMLNTHCSPIHTNSSTTPSSLRRLPP